VHAFDALIRNYSGYCMTYSYLNASHKPWYDDISLSSLPCVVTYVMTSLMNILNTWELVG